MTFSNDEKTVRHVCREIRSYRNVRCWNPYNSGSHSLVINGLSII